MLGVLQLIAVGNGDPQERQRFLPRAAETFRASMAADAANEDPKFNLELTLRMMEKQKLRFHYGIMEKQFRRYVAEASRQKGPTGRILITLLESMGHRVEVAVDGVSGLDKALAHAPDVALVDVGLPQIDGYEIARRIRDASRGGRRPYLVAITGYGLAEDRARAFEAGFDAHLVKPVDPDELERLLATAPAPVAQSGT